MGEKKIGEEEMDHENFVVDFLSVMTLLLVFTNEAEISLVVMIVRLLLFEERTCWSKA